MILPPAILQQFAHSPQMTIEQARVMLLNYVYYKKNIVYTEILNASITNIPNFEKQLTRACNYFY